MADATIWQVICAHADKAPSSKSPEQAAQNLRNLDQADREAIPLSWHCGHSSNRQRLHSEPTLLSNRRSEQAKTYFRKRYI